MAVQNGVPEMGKYLRQLVDNSLEEGQFESAIAMLEQLRSPDHKPSVIHILHLLFISLHSASHDCRLDDSATDPTYDRAALLLQSPRKIVKQAKAALVLSPQAILAAQRLLSSFISTNSPQDIAAALPHYPETEGRRQVNTGGEDGAQLAFEFLDSPIYNQSASIRNARSVWEIIKEGYANRAMQMYGTPKGRSKGKQGLKSRALARESSFGMSSSTGAVEGEEIKVVGEDSWFLLDWLVELFERDAEVVQGQGMQKHSPLLLKQLPPPPINTSTRWDASEPLKVVLYSLQQSDSRRQRTGLRLLNLLIDLTYTSYLNLPSFALTMLAQLASSSSSSTTNSPQSSRPNSPATRPAQSHEPTANSNLLKILFTLLPSTSAPLAFKVALCQKILQDLDGTASSSSGPYPTPRFSGGSAINANSSANGVNSSEGPGMGTNAATGELVSILKRPRAVPRPRTNATLAPPPDEAGGTVPPQVMASASLGASAGSSATTTTGTTAPTSAMPSNPPIPPRPRIPPVAEVSRLVKLQAKKESRSLAPQPRTHHRHPNPHAAQNTPQTPWTAPGVLLRVKFELLLACATMMVRARSELEADVPGSSAPPDVLDWAQSLTDGRMQELLRDVFASPGPASGDEGKYKEDEDRAFYADVIRAVVGFPVDVP
ncbi:hypothetical protein BDZ97DRAFT_1912601 [Flammula alnicola]|nr:hypothetical protein BDZ97DRAFT_1912601 [Flammula alnicola]